MNETTRVTQRPLDILDLAPVDVNGAIQPYLDVFVFRYVHRSWADTTIGLVGANPPVLK